MAVACPIDDFNNWNEVFNQSYLAPVVSQTPRFVFEPIPKQELGLTLISPIIMAIATTEDDGLSRSHLATIVQQLNIGAGFPDDQATGTGWRLYRDQLALIQFPDLGVPYSLLLLPKFYVANLTLQVWELKCQ